MALKNTSGVTQGEAEIITDRLRVELFNTGKVSVMERDQMQEVLKEQQFQQSGACSDEACLVKMGQILGVEQLATGTIGKLGSMYLLNVRMISIETAQVTRVVSRDIDGGIEEVIGYLWPIAAEITGGEDATNSAVERSPAALRSPPMQRQGAPVLDEEHRDHNRNRCGMRTGYSAFLGGWAEKIEIAHFDTTGARLRDSVAETSEKQYLDVIRHPVRNAALALFVKAGPSYTIDIGYCWDGGTARHVQKNASGGQTRSDDLLAAHSLLAGVTWVKRRYPLKFNIGALAGGTLFRWSEKQNEIDASGIAVGRDTTYTMRGAGFFAGSRAGVEILLGSHIGLIFEGVFRYSSLYAEQQTLNERDTTSGIKTGSLTLQRELRLPRLAPSTGLCWYF
jgi:hypothetical protein